MCSHTNIVCPNHEGGFDCTPFCNLCEGEQEFCPSCELVTYSDWENTYKPINNHITEEGNSFETYGDEVNFVCSQDNYNVWTEMDGDNGVYLVNGYHMVNRINYYVTEVPWQEGDDICITICEYVTCSCYNEETEEGDPDCDKCYGDGSYTDWKD